MADPIRDLIADLSAKITEGKQRFDDMDKGLSELKTAVDAALPPVASNTIRVRPGDDLGAAIASLKEGGTILGAPGEYFLNYEPIERASRAFVTIKTDTANLPGETKRMTREHYDGGGLMVLRSANRLDGVIRAAAKPVGGLAFVGVAFGPQAPDRTQIELGWDSGTLKSRANVPLDYLFDRCVFVGDPAKGQHRAIQANCMNLIIRGCGFYDFFEFGRDSQAVCGWNGTQNVQLLNSYLEASAENVMWGGAPSASAEMNPRQVQMIGCHLAKRREWMALTPETPVIKAIFELKNVEDYYMAGCLLEGCWRKNWASGVGLTLKIAPSSTAAAAWSTMKNVVIEDIVVRNVGKPLDVIGWDGGLRAENVDLRNWLIYNVNREPYLGDNRGISIFDIPHGLEVDHFTMAGPLYNAKNSFIMISSPTPAEGAVRTEKARGFRFTNSLVDHGSYAIFGSQAIGKPALDLFCHTDYVMEGNAVRKGSGSRALPAGNPVIDGAAFDASFEADGFTLLPGSPVAAVPTTDGTLVGANIEKIRGRLADPF